VAGIDFASDVLGNVTDAVDIGDRGSAEFHDEAGHGVFGRLQRQREERVICFAKALFGRALA